MIGIYRLTAPASWTTHGWLCARHVEARRADRWLCEQIGDVDGNCLDCESERQAAPGYRTPMLVPLVLSADRKHIPAKGTPETIGCAKKTQKPATRRQRQMPEHEGKATK